MPITTTQQCHTSPIVASNSYPTDAISNTIIPIKQRYAFPTKPRYGSPPPFDKFHVNPHSVPPCNRQSERTIRQTHLLRIPISDNDPISSPAIRPLAVSMSMALSPCPLPITRKDYGRSTDLLSEKISRIIKFSRQSLFLRSCHTCIKIQMISTS